MSHLQTRSKRQSNMKNPTTGQKGSIPQSSNKNDNINSHNNNNEHFWLPISDEPKAFTNKQTNKNIKRGRGKELRTK